MNTITVSVTDFRDNLAEYLNMVKYGKKKIIIKKNRFPAAEISPLKPTPDRRKNKRIILPEAFGMWKNRWPKTMSSVDIVNKWRKEAWEGRYGN